MLTQMTTNVETVFCSQDASSELTNLHNSFKYNLHKGFGYNSVTVSNNIATLTFTKHIGATPEDDINVNPILLDQVQQIVESYKQASFESLKNSLIDRIDSRTRELISKGAQFDGHHFSLSDNAQRNWIAIKAAVDIYQLIDAFPVPVTTYDDNVYFLRDTTHIIQFTGAMLSAVAKHYNSGRDLKLLVKAASTAEEINAIKDKRV